MPEDTETGWHYNWHRYYEPETGRYLTPDPIGLRGGDNAFGYAGGDPLGALDPDGLLVVMVFNQANGTLQVRDMDRQVSGAPEVIVRNPSEYNPARQNQVLEISGVFTGENRYLGAEPSSANRPIPQGAYEILDNRLASNPNTQSWFRLDPLDEVLRNDRHEDTGRGAFRLHLGLNSHGCVTVSFNPGNPQNSQFIINQEMYRLAESILYSTSTEQVENGGAGFFSPSSHRYLTLYGIMIVE